MAKRFFVLLMVALFVFFCRQSVYAESQVVNVTGVAPYTMVQDYQVLRDNVFTKTQGYIQKYDVVNAGAKGNLYEVTISATVAVENLKDDLPALRLLHARVEKPRE